MKIFLDDCRYLPIPMEKDGWILVETYEECIKELETRTVTHLSLDHDLGTEKTGYDVAKWLEEKVMCEGFVPPLTIYLHSANPVGLQNMKNALVNFSAPVDISRMLVDYEELEEFLSSE